MPPLYVASSSCSSSSSSVSSSVRISSDSDDVGLVLRWSSSASSEVEKSASDAGFRFPAVGLADLQ
jgi:hypothetical protein